jgi:signal peptidase I
MDLNQFKERKIHLKATGEYQGRIATGSMEPLIIVGDIIKVEAVKLEQLQKFDIIVFYQHEKLICHFVWHKSRFGNQDEVITKSLIGGEDLPIKKEFILGRVTNFQLSFFDKIKMSWKYRKSY